MSDIQSHLDADVTALAESLAALEAEITALKGVPPEQVDFTRADALVASAKDAVANLAPPAPAPAPAPAPPAPLAVGTTLPEGTVGVAYSATASATGGTPPYSWEISGLPDGLTAGSDGTITGTPTSMGLHSVALTVTAGGQTASATAGLSIAQAQVPAPEAPAAPAAEPPPS